MPEKIVEKPFREPIVLDSRDLISPQDERDYILPVPPIKEKDLVRQYFDQSLPILNQGNTDYCTAFASYRSFANHLPGAKRDEFIFSNENALQIAKWQFGWLSRETIKRLLRMEIWRFQGRNMRACLWNLNKGVQLMDGAKIKINEYWRCEPETPLDLCRYIQKHGSLIAGLLIKGYFVQGEYRRDGTLRGGHAIEVNGFSTKKQVFYFTNSWGETWGNKGKGTIPFSAFTDMAEIWWMKGMNFAIKGSPLP